MTRRTKRLFKNAIWCCATLSISTAVIAQTISTRAEKLSAIDADQQLMDRLHKQFEAIQKQSEQTSLLRQACETRRQRLITEDEVANKLRELRHLADANTLTLKLTRGEKTALLPAVSELPVSIELTGNFNGLYSFLLQLEQSPQPTRIEQLQIDSGGEQAAPRMSLKISLFVRPSDAMPIASGGRK